jgi:hypothetical protein
MEFTPYLLAAGDSRFSDLVRYLNRASTSRENLIFILFAVIIAGIWAALFMWDRMRRMAPATPKVAQSLFDQLCQAHRLDAGDSTLLSEAAREFNLASPALLFVQPDHLTRLSADGVEHAAGYRQLRERLFGAI